VGVRPFEREEGDLFRGRERDIPLLTSKIFSAKLTLFYARSGVGKSSLLRAKVIPLLEAEGAQVVYFDAWTGERPLEGLTTALAGLATQRGISDAGAGGPTLADLARLITRSGRGCTLVLALDQFEEFLSRSGAAVDAVRAELVDLARAPSLDVRILLSLRQEYLAALEPFRADLLDLFGSTYLLEPLDEKGLREAIEVPALLFRREVEPELTRQLISELRAETARIASSPERDDVDLPLLQLVCEQLWAAAEDPACGIRDRITPEFFRRVGPDVRHVLDRYIHAAMPSSLDEQYVTAKLLQLLAPSSGLKAAYPASDLADMTEVPVADVQRHLDTLVAGKILRTRAYGKVTNHELLHDAFIRYLVPWRQEVLLRWREREAQRQLEAQRAEAAKRKRPWFAVGGIALALLLALSAWALSAQSRREWEARVTRGALEELTTTGEADRARLATPTFDRVTSLLLWESERGRDVRRRARLHELERLLKEFRPLLPAGYGFQQGAQASSSREDAPIVVRYSPARAFDEQAFGAAWSEASRALTERTGIPVPASVRLERDPTLNQEQIVVWFGQGAAPGGGASPAHRGLGPGTRGARSTAQQRPDAAVGRPSSLERKAREGALELVVPDLEDDAAFISTTELAGPAAAPARAFLREFPSEFRRLADSGGGDWLAVPRWSLPVWKVSGVVARPASALPAEMLARRLSTTAPELLLTPEIVRLLVQRAGEADPAAATYGWIARGARLRQDLIALVRAGQSLADLPELLEELGQDPSGSSTALGSAIAASLRQGRPWYPERLSGPQRLDQLRLEPAPPLADAYAAASANLPSLQRQVRVELGAELAAELLDPDGSLTQRTRERLDVLYDKLLDRLGVEPPPAVVRAAAPEAALAARGIRVVLGVERDSGQREEVPAGRDALSALESAVERVVTDRRAFLVTTADVTALRSTLRPELQAWLDRRYGRSDLKVLLRALLAPPRGAGPEGSREAVSLRDPDWLLRSLVFWSRALPQPDRVEALAGALRELGRPLETTAGPAAPLAVSTAVERGIVALERGQLGVAEVAFDQALREEGASVMRVFRSAYPPRRGVRTDLARARCAEPWRGGLSRRERLAVSEVVERSGEDLTADERLQLKLCLLASYPAERRERRIALASDVLARSAVAWSPREAALISEVVLLDLALLPDGASLRDRGAEVFRSAVLRLDESAAADSNWKLMGSCDVRKDRLWCWRLVANAAASRTDGALALDYALQLTDRSNAADLKDAIRWARRARAAVRTQALLPAARQRRLDFAAFVDARATVGLLASADPDLAPSQAREAADTLERLTTSTAVGPVARHELVRLALVQDRVADAEAQLAIAAQAESAAPVPLYLKLYLLLAKRDTAALLALSRELRASPNQTAASLLTASLGQLLVRDGGDDWLATGATYLQATDENVPYFAMIFHARCATSGKPCPAIDGRRVRRDSDPASWSARLREGDVSPWPEMLVSNYLGERTADQLRDLEDPAAFARSDLRFLPQGRDRLRCDAYFYDGMLACLRGDSKRMRDRLRDAVATNQRDYLEYRIARYMLEGAPSAWTCDGASVVTATR
jgi:hypothetical protein